MLKSGLYEQIITERLHHLLAALPPSQQQNSAPIEAGEAHERLARHLYSVLRDTLRGLSGEEKEKLEAQLALCNAILAFAQQQSADNSILGERIDVPALELLAVEQTHAGYQRPARPLVPLSASALLVNDGERVSIGAAIRRELESADSVDLICAFVNHTGVRILEREMRALCQRGRLRLITTTYMGATQRKALDALAAWGAEIKVTYELPPANTKLHAKAWMFHRNTGFHTAYIGSSNLSHSALVDGLEWNVRLSENDTAPILAKFRSTFERYWADPVFETYDPARDQERLDRALQTSGSEAGDTLDFFLDLEPRPHQREILEALEVERERHDKWRNLVVAATGTGKTVVAALDYKRLKQQWGSPRLLFVAHRREILDQSLKTFRTALRDGAFGERWVEGNRPTEFQHVFASIQSLSYFALEQLPPDHFDVVIVDEFHHAEAATYRRLLDYVRPRVLLGLTATPERTDGGDVRDFFGGESTVELRLWDALEQGLLCPFQYFGIADNEDLTDVEWKDGKYSTEDLESKYVRHGEARAALIFEQTRRIVTDWRTMRAIGFCVSIKHAQFMANKCAQYGVACAALSSETGGDERRQAVRDLRSGKLNIVFAVDIFNEGVDLPEVDTVLFLRPTESATVYIQQLGRGLRLCEGKSCLTVLDFIGLQNQKFRFEFRYRALTGLSRTALQEQVQQDFPLLPAGCHMQLDKVARQTVLDNLKNALPTSPRRMRAELRTLAKGDADYPLDDFLRETGLQPEDVYRGGRYYEQIKREAGLVRESASEAELKLGGAMQRLLAVDDPERVNFYSDVLRKSAPPSLNSLPVREQRKLFMLVYGLLRDFKILQLDDALERLWREEAIRAEIIQLLKVLGRRSVTLPHLLDVPALVDVPLNVHTAYTKDEIMAALGKSNPAAMREGVYYSPSHAGDVLFVTLRKTERDFSPTTRYQDYPISPELFHWETQSTTREASPTAQRYIHHATRNSSVLLMVRESKHVEGRTSPYICLGTAQYVGHESERPLRVTWRLDTPMPESLYQQFRTAAG